MLNNQDIYNLTQFIIKNKRKKDLFALFNEWSVQYKIQFVDYNEAIWVLNHIKAVQKMDTAIIEEAQILDKKIIEKERMRAFNGKNKKETI